MLDAETKRRIDTARDILVGKVPDPKSQVEQITIALIYKFMDDMDAMSEELDGERSFFAGEFAGYGWARLMQPGLGGHEMLNLYAEAIERMDQNAGIPQLFRDIFSNAFLPYRDPETLRAFLKVIDGFSYDHSERLGDAFEYLLSVMDSQGDAGQFRTPRHIIDFIVAIVDPKKDETVLDPACGTAGFLISSYKHIWAANTDADGNNTLTPDDRERLARSFLGYDISPDMVRLSLVNMYLHGFVDPHIHEYDTLTSEERWDEYADVILANPPFMSPKGGIRPHRRFSVQSKRSEVLFVDYMADHLNAGGRAGIIVPEGIIFQSQKAHKQLRKKLVEESLVAVVSLPSGVFNPYSGVKTSILLLDKGLARRTDRIGFFKVEHDGYGLGAQRRPIDKNDLPQVRDEIAAYMQRLQAEEAGSDLQPNSGLIVEKERVAADGDYNLSGERYREIVNNSEWPLVSLGAIAREIRAGFACGNGKTGNEGIPHIRPMNLTENGQFTWNGLKRISKENFRGREDYVLQPGDVLFNNTNSKELVGKTCHVDEKIIGGFSNHITRIRVDEEKCISGFLAHVLHAAWSNEMFLSRANKWIGQAGINTKSLSGFHIPLPPLEVQQEIVAEIEGYQKVIDGARAVVENYRPHIHIDSDWPVEALGDFCEIFMGQSPSGTTYNKEGNGVPLINGPVEFGPEAFSKTLVNQFTTAPTKMCRKGDLILCVRGSTTGRMNIAGYSGCIGRGVAAIRSRTSQQWVNYIVNSLRDQIFRLGTGSTFPNVTRDALAGIPVPVPPLHVWEEIVKKLEAERALIAGNNELIERLEQKIQDAIARVWGDGEKQQESTNNDTARTHVSLPD